MRGGAQMAVRGGVPGGRAYNLVETLGGTETSWASTDNEDINLSKRIEVMVVSYFPVCDISSCQVERRRHRERLGRSASELTYQPL